MPEHDCRQLSGALSRSSLCTYFLTKPAADDNPDPGILADSRRMNVALTHARRVLIIISNLEKWDNTVFARMYQKESSRTYIVGDIPAMMRGKKAAALVFLNSSLFCFQWIPKNV